MRIYPTGGQNSQPALLIDPKPRRSITSLARSGIIKTLRLEMFPALVITFISVGRGCPKGLLLSGFRF